MLCQNCGKNTATSYVHSVVNGVVKDKYLCSECASKQKLNELYNDDIFKMFSSFFGTGAVNKATKKCDSCGITFDEILSTGRLGCPNCYEAFYNELMPTLKKVHGSTMHIGSHPNNMPDSKEIIVTDKIADELSLLKQQLKEAIENEEYEKAAVLRDQIRKKEEE